MFRPARFRSPALALAASVVIAATAPAPAHAAYEQQAAATREYAQHALEFVRSVGVEKAKAAFTDGRKEWLLGPEKFNLHVAGMDKGHNCWADTAFPEINGTNLDDLFDVDGQSIGKLVFDALAASPSGAAVQARFNDPVTKAVAHSEGYCLPVDGGNVLCAWSEAK